LVEKRQQLMYNLIKLNSTNSRPKSPTYPVRSKVKNLKITPNDVIGSFGNGVSGKQSSI